jgi:hypothetical protein
LQRTFSGVKLQFRFIVLVAFWLQTDSQKFSNSPNVLV